MRGICGYCMAGEHGRCKKKVALYLLWPRHVVRCSCPRHSWPPCDYNAFPGWTCTAEKGHDGPCPLWPKSRRARKEFGRRDF